MTVAIESTEVNSLSWSRLASYAAPATGSFFFYIPMLSILPAIYGKYFGLELSAIASAVILIRLFDGFTDPIIGYLSDWHRARQGSRKTWVVFGGFGAIIACYHLFIPSQGVSASYFLFWSLTYYLALTISDVPHLVWGTELTMDYNKRTQVYSMRTIAYKMGVLCFYAMPLLPFYASNSYTPEVLKDAFLVGSSLTLLGLLWALLCAPSGKVVLPIRRDSLSLIVRSIVGNSPLIIYFLAYVCIGLSYGMWFGLLYFYLDSYLLLGDSMALMFTIATLVSLFSAPIWSSMVRKTSKQSAWAMGTILFVLQLIGMLFLESTSDRWIAMVLIVMAFVSFAGHNIAPLAILGDIIDFGKLKFHQDRGATYFAINNLLYKIGLGLGSGLALAVAGIFDFDPAGESQGAMAILGLKLGFIYIPSLFLIAGIFFIAKTPINRRRQAIIKKRLVMRSRQFSQS